MSQEEEELKEFIDYKDQTTHTHRQESKGCSMIDRIDKLYARIINCQMIGKHLQASYVMFIHQ